MNDENLKQLKELYPELDLCDYKYAPMDGYILKCKDGKKVRVDVFALADKINEVYNAKEREFRK